MLLVSEDTSKGTGGIVTNDAPPAYEEVESAGPSSSQSPFLISQSEPQPVQQFSSGTDSLPLREHAHSLPLPPSPVPPRIKPGNFINSFRYVNNTFDTFYIDPTFNVPFHQRPPLQSGETDVSRRNLNIGTSMGVIDSDVTIVGDDPATAPERKVRCTIQVKNKMGSSTLRVHASNSSHRHAIFIRMFSRAGPISVELPISFAGILSISGIGPLTLSEGIKASSHVMSTSPTSRRLSIGDMKNSPWNKGDEMNWSGDECVIEATLGPVNIGFDDESRRAGSSLAYSINPHKTGRLDPVNSPMRTDHSSGIFRERLARDYQRNPRNEHNSRVFGVIQTVGLGSWRSGFGDGKGFGGT